MNRYFRFYTMDIDAREAMLDSVERLTELPLLLLSFIMIPLSAGTTAMGPVGDRGFGLHHT